MTEFVTSVIQQHVKIYDSPLEYQTDVFGFLKAAQAKNAQLAVLPALSPLALVLPLASSIQLDLLKRSKRISEGAGLAEKILKKAAATAAQMMGGVQGQLIQLLENYPEEIFDAYIDLFSAAALKFKMTIVAGSFYLREHSDRKPIHTTYVFGPDGMILGRQAKIQLTSREARFCQPGSALKVIDTPVGRIGILIEEDVLFPESSRVLAFQGAEILINQIARPGLPSFLQTRNAFLARVDENEVLGIQSALVGSNILDPNAADWVGNSALLQPFQLSWGGNGILHETSNATKEALITETLSLEHLREYWIRPTPRLRRGMRLEAYTPLTEIYNSEKALDPKYWPQAGETPDDESRQQPGDESPLRSPFIDDNVDDKPE